MSRIRLAHKLTLSRWLRVTLAIGSVVGMAVDARPVAAQPSGNASAETYNEEGKQLLYDNKPGEAAAKFRLAIAVSPEGRFYYNLCVAQYQEGQFGEALASCDSVAPNGADAALTEKAAKFRGKIVDEMTRQGLDTGAATPGTDPTNPGSGNPSNPGDPTNPSNPSGAGTSPVYGQPPPPATAQPKLTKEYMWSLGGLVFLPNGTNIGMDDNDYNAGVGIQLNAEYMLHKPWSLGVQGFFGYVGLPSADSATDRLSIVELGATGFKNICRGDLCVTPRLGVLLADFAPGNAYSSAYSGETYQTWGLTAELSAGLSVGRNKDGFIYAQGGLRQYAGIKAEGADTFGLNDNMTLSYIGIGYMRRFAKPWNDSPSAFVWRLE